MSAPKSKPMKPRARKLLKDRAAATTKPSKPAKSKKKTAGVTKKAKANKAKANKAKANKAKANKPKSNNPGTSSTRPKKSSNSKVAPKNARTTSNKEFAQKPRAASSTRSSTKTFTELGVHPELSKALMRNGISEPFAIQKATLPDAISGKDVLGRAQTGSGKTLAFGLAMLTRLAGVKTKPRQPLGLILVPTRELAMQVTDALTGLAHTVDLDVRLIAGGMPYKKQIDALLKGVPILVSTPGRLSDLVDQGHADLSRIQIVVLDEADQMCDMGFMPQIVEILDLVPKRGQRLLFSATLDGDVNRLVSTYLKNPVLHETAEAKATVATMEHHLLIVDRNSKDEILNRIAARDGKTIIFVRTQAAADRVSTQMAQVGIPVGALHGGKSQNLRTRTINEFREGVTNVLVATDVAARGIHVDGISLVVHADPPGDPKDYLHRSGRTARAGDAGKVVTLIGARQQRTVLNMMDRVAVSPPVHRVTAESRELIAVTGAKQPSGKPWKLPKSNKQQSQRPSRGRNTGRPHRRKATDSGAKRHTKTR